MEKSKSKIFLESAYNVVIIILAVVSIIMAIMDICGKVGADNTAFYLTDNVILIIFAIDYIVRFIIAPKKIDFFKNNVFDLIAIIPFSSVFSFFRFARLFRLAKFSRLLKLTKFARVVGVFGKIKRQADKFLHTNGFIYMLYAAVVLIILSSILISYFENKTFSDALWWSIVTCTTVGYGDISPVTGIGRVVAVILMVFGIGMISMLTGTITTFFSQRYSEKNNTLSDINDIIEKMDDTQRQELLQYLSEKR